MCDSEFTYMDIDFEECSTSEENGEDSFIVNETILANVWLLLNEEENEDYDYGDNYKDNDENNDENNCSENDEDIYIKIEDTSVKSSDLTSCVILDIIDNEIKY
ncbi:2243_t:CDS:1, partial [Diversispora eburnea]